MYVKIADLTNVQFENITEKSRKHQNDLIQCVPTSSFSLREDFSSRVLQYVCPTELWWNE